MKTGIRPSSRKIEKIPFSNPPLDKKNLDLTLEHLCLISAT